MNGIKLLQSKVAIGSTSSRQNLETEGIEIMEVRFFEHTGTCGHQTEQKTYEFEIDLLLAR